MGSECEGDGVQWKIHNVKVMVWRGDCGECGECEVETDYVMLVSLCRSTMLSSHLRLTRDRYCYSTLC